MKLGSFPSNKLPELGFSSYLAESSSFSPTDISGLLVWNKSESLDVLSIDDPISTWADSSGNGYDLTGSLTVRPLKKTVSSRSCALFDGSNDILANTALPARSTNPFTIYVVLKRVEDTLTWQTYFQFGDNTNTNMAANYDNSSNHILNVNSFGSAPPAGGPTASLNTEIIRIRRSTNIFLSQNDGVEVDFGNITLNPDPGYIVGGETVYSQYFGGYIFEVLVYDSSLSEENQELVEAYLAEKFTVTMA